jgi:SsrA-binding protein
MAKGGDLVSNRKAGRDYIILDTYEAGIALKGSEIQSLRNQGGNLQDAYVLISESGAALLKNAHIATYRFGSAFNPEEKRDRVLLLHKREILKLRSATSEKGLTLIPLAIYLKGGFAKVKIGICKGKRDYDKRESLKKRDAQREIDRELKGK